MQPLPEQPILDVRVVEYKLQIKTCKDEAQHNVSFSGVLGVPNGSTQ